MSLASIAKKPIKKVFTAMPILDVLSRRFLYKRVYPRLFFHEPEMRFFYNLPKGSFDVVVDIGAAMGSFCWILEGRSNKIYAFEPGRIHNKCLNEASFGTNIEVIRAAVGSGPGTVNLYTPGSDSTDRYCASVSAANPVTQAADALVDEVPQIAIDDYMAEHLEPGRSIDFFKVDIEGYEFEAFKGARKTLETHHPLIIAEIEERHNPDYRDVFRFLADLGYSAYTYRDGRFTPHDGENIEAQQRPEDLEKRLHGGPDELSAYVNNFIFMHPQSKVKIPV
ncbi:FkbM family methyltransferase [Sphingopyxis sp.]|uniref:FkbM family methyltransferase n=1 Tax=Sphingopyxis sp. TaxID=1908224 RepID=UPI003D100C90